MNEVERLEEKMKSKNWKERQEAYIRFKDFINQEGFAFLIPLIQNETNIPALESGIEALLQAEKVPPVESVAKIFGHIGNLKTSVRTKVVNLIEFISKKYHNQCVNVLVDYILLKSTPPKTVAGAISVLVEITDKYDLNLEIVGSSLKQIFGHADKSVRGEGTRLCVGLYKKFGENIRKFIKDLKPIQLKELEEEFNKIQPEINKKDYAPLSLSNSKLLKKCNDEKWNIRLEGLNELKAQIPFTFDNEILSIFYTRISDPNNQVFFELLEILALTKLKNQRIVNGLVERLKDKKTIVCEKIKETLLKMELPEDFLQKEYFTHKNPQVKINIIDYALKREVKRKDVEEWVKGCTKDQNGQVRSKANEFLNKKNMEGNKVQDKEGNSKIGSKVGIGIGSKIEDVNISINKPITTTPIKTINTPIKRIKTSYFGPTQEEKDSILNSFYSKYPFFKEKMWNTRLESLKDNTPLLLKEEIRDLMVFFYSHKENIFQLNLAHLDLLSKRQKELDLVKNTLLLYCTEKITENKLQNKIVEILKKIDQKETILFIKNEIKNLKQGKKLICLIWLIGELISKKNCEIDEIFKKNVTGINEKKAIEGLKKRFDEIQSVCELNREDKLNGEDGFNREDELNSEDYPSERVENGLNRVENGLNRVEDGLNREDGFNEPTNKQVEDEPSNKRMTNTKKNTSINFFTNEMKNEINNLNFELNQPIKKGGSPIHPSYPLPTIHPSPIHHPLTHPPLNKPPQVLKTNKRFPGDKEEDIFTSDFIQILHSSDFTKVLDLFNTTDKILISDFIIKYHVEKRLASSYFNSLILFFISEKYILKENECLILLSYLLKNNLKEELKMMDRIYPVTKLFFVLQKIGTDEAINEILRLIESYKMFRGDKKKFIEKLKETNLKKLKKTVRECPDFLSFIDEIDEQFLNEKGCESVSRDVSRDYEEKGDVRDVECKDKATLKGFNPKSNLLDTTKVPNSTKITHSNPTKISTPSKLLAPSVLDDPFQDPLIESSLHSLSLNSGFNTPNLNKFKKEFESPIKKRNSIDTLEDILDNLIDSNQDKSEKAFLRLSGLVDDNMPSLLFSANSIISSISIQLLDVLHRPLYATLILNVLLKLSKSQLFCEELRVETLESVNSDLITMFDSLNKDRNPSKDHLQLVLDIITNLSLNCKPLMAIQVYLNLFSKGGNRDIHLRLIWRHSKCLNQIDKDNLEGIIEVFEKFYSKHVYSPFMENRTTFKMLILHIGQIVLKYPKEIEKMKLKGYTKILIELFKTKSSIKIEDLRKK